MIEGELVGVFLDGLGLGLFVLIAAFAPLSVVYTIRKLLGV